MDYPEELKQTADDSKSFLVKNQRYILYAVAIVLGADILGFISLGVEQYVEDAEWVLQGIKVALLSLVLTRLYFPRFRKKVIEPYFRPDYIYLAFVDALAEEFAVGKTHPDSLTDQVEEMRFIDDQTGEVLQKAPRRTGRDGVLRPRRDYYLVRDAQKNDKGGYDLYIEPAYPSASDDQIIANKNVLGHYRDEVVPDARFGRQARQSFTARLERAKGRVARQLTVLHEHALGEDTVMNPEEIFGEYIEGYDRTDLDADDMTGDSDPMESVIDETASEYIQKVEQDAGVPEPNTGGDNNE